MIPELRSLLLTVCCCVIALAAQGQANFRPGYVLPLSGDTLRGEVDFRDGRLNAQRCRFRPSAQAAAVDYRPAQLRGYGSTAENRHYRSLAVALEDAAAPQTCFLEVLEDGPASLYYFRDPAQREEFFIGLPNQPLALLKHGFVQVSNGGNQTGTVMQTGYRNTLAAALANCPAVERKLPKLAFQESALINVVNTYNRECAGYKPVRPQSTAAKSHLALGVVAGAAQQKLSYNGFPSPTGVVAQNTYTGVVFGPTLRFTSGRLGQRLSLITSALYSPEKFEIAPVYTINGVQQRPLRYTFDVTYLRVPLVVRYTFGNGKIKPFGEAGFAVGYAFSANNTAEQYNSITGAYVPATGPFSGSNNIFREVETCYGGSIGAGTSVGGRLMSLQLRVEKGDGFSRALDIGASVVRFYGLIGVDLTK